MVTATTQRRITYILVGVSVVYLVLILRNNHREAINDRLRPLRAKPIHFLNRLFGLNITTNKYYSSPPLYTPNCPFLIADNKTEQLRTRQYLTKTSQPLTPNEYYIQAGQNCPKFLLDNNYTTTYHQVPLKFPTAYVITAHTSVQQFNILMHAIYNEHNVYCVHLDNSSTPLFRKAIEAVIGCIPNVFAATKSVNVIYNDHSELRAEFHCLRDLLSLPTHWRYVVNLDESSFPLKSNTETTDLLKKLEDRNLIEGKVSISEDRYIRYKYRHIPVGGKLVQTQEPKDAPPANLALYHGSPYYAATRDFIHFVLSNYYAGEFYNWLNETYAPRELYWATMNTIYEKNQNLDRRQEVLPAHYYKIRTQTTGEVADDRECLGEYVRNSCVFGLEALPQLRQRRELFASKFDIEYDHVALLCLDDTITNPYYNFDAKLDTVAT